MKKLIFSTILTALTICGLYAQDVKFGVRGGMSMANMSAAKSTPISEGFAMRTAPGWGIFTELQLDPKISVRFGVEYSPLGGKKNGMQAMPTERLVTAIGSSFGMPSEEQIDGLMAIARSLPPYYYLDIKNTVKLDYVTIPLLGQMGWDIGQTPWRVYVNAGPVLSFILSGKQVSKGSSLIYNEEGITIWSSLNPVVQGLIAAEFPPMQKLLTEPVPSGETNITGEMKSANFGVAGNIGLRYQHGNNFFFLEAGGNYGFYTVQDSDANGSNRLGAITVMVGYAFSLF